MHKETPVSCKICAEIKADIFNSSWPSASKAQAAVLSSAVCPSALFQGPTDSHVFVVFLLIQLILCAISSPSGNNKNIF